MAVSKYALAGAVSRTKDGSVQSIDCRERTGLACFIALHELPQFSAIFLLTQRKDLYSNLFEYIRYAMLKDGSRLETEALRERLFPVEAGHSRSKRPELKTNLYDADLEREIDYFVMQAASFSAKETENAQEVGYWDYNYLEHPKTARSARHGHIGRLAGKL